MPELPGFVLQPLEGRSAVHLRVRPAAAEAAAQALDLQHSTLQWRDGDPAAYWLAPDQWQFTSDTLSAQAITAKIDTALAGQLYATTDVSSCQSGFLLTGKSARTLLAMGCCIDMHPRAFVSGQCARTRFADVRLLIAAVSDNAFELYVDRSHALHLSNWITRAGEDPFVGSGQALN